MSNQRRVSCRAPACSWRRLRNYGASLEPLSDPISVAGRRDRRSEAQPIRSCGSLFEHAIGNAEGFRFDSIRQRVFGHLVVGPEIDGLFFAVKAAIETVTSTAVVQRAIDASGKVPTARQEGAVLRWRPSRIGERIAQQLHRPYIVPTVNKRPSGASRAWWVPSSSQIRSNIRAALSSQLNFNAREWPRRRISSRRPELL